MLTFTRAFGLVEIDRACLLWSYDIVVPIARTSSFPLLRRARRTLRVNSGEVLAAGSFHPLCMRQQMLWM